MSEGTPVVRTIGRYQALEEIGRGAMGVVYRAFDPVIGRTVALKTIDLAVGDSEAKTLRERLYREATAAGTLTHPNIVTVFDVIEDGPIAAVAVELVDGQTLEALIAQQGALPLDRALDLFEQICAALDYAGGKGIIHRDIKPANILLTPDGRAKVTDFGIARLGGVGVTQTTTVMGSPSYMSPEQVRGLPLDIKSDLFSAAVILYEMLSGERPFAGDDVATTLYRIVNEPARGVEHFNPSIAPGVSAVVHRALAKDPADRYLSGAELVAELRRAVSSSSQPLTAARIPLPATAKKRSPLLVIVVAGGGVIVLLLLLVVLGSGASSKTPTQTPPQNQSASPVPAAPAEIAPPVTIPESTALPAQMPYSGPVSTVPPLQPATASRASGRQPAEPPREPAGRAARVDRRDGGAPDTSSPRSVSPNDSPPFGSPVTKPLAEATTETPRSAGSGAPSVSSTELATSPPTVRPVPTSGDATLRAAFDGSPYAFSLFSGDTRVGRIDAPDSVITVEAGTLRLRAVNEALFLNADLGVVTVRPGERRTVTLPGVGSAVLSVRGEDYSGVRILIDGRQLPGPYPAQLPRLAAGQHQVAYRWISGPRAGREIEKAVTILNGGHFLVRAAADDEQIVVQQLR